MDLISVNPATGNKINIYNELNINDLDTLVNKSNSTYHEWSILSIDSRAVWIKKAASVLRERKTEFAVLMSTEMGKPVAQAESEVEKCAYVLEYYAENASKFLEDEFVETKYSKSIVSYRPLGVILGIMPWNFPFWQVFRFTAPQLMAGNTVVLKHSNNTTGCALAIEDVFRSAGFPDGVFSTMVVDVDKVERVIKNPFIKGISFTGSLRVGKIVAAQAGAVMKKSVFELGGSDPYIILDDADLENAANAIVNARFNNAGQTCISPKRIIVTKNKSEEFIKYILETAKTWKCDVPTKTTPNIIGPLARFDLLETFSRQIEESIRLGAKCLMGGKVWPGCGFFYQPTILVDVKPGMPAYDEELFGPAIAIITAENEDDAIRIANDTEFGLGGAIFTTDIERAEYIAKNQLQCGAVFINDFVQSDPKLPFGGINASGYGRELGIQGIREFTNIKTICVK